MDVEKVIHGLESCSCYAGVPDICGVTECPYRGDVMCQHNLSRDALKLLDTQSAVIMQYKKVDTFLATHGWKW
jgi:hypothetical protein